jgi:valyl-tRNA synthetase
LPLRLAALFSSSQPVFYGTDETAKRAAQDTLYTCVEYGLKLISPFMPFLSEEV